MVLMSKLVAAGAGVTAAGACATGAGCGAASAVAAALGAVTLTQRSYDETVFEANKAELGPFRSEFDDIDDAYWYDKDARTYLIRRADKAIWVVVYADNYNGAVLVAEGPLPEAPAKQ